MPAAWSPARPALRHPEKARTPAQPRLAKPPWLKIKPPRLEAFAATQKVLRRARIATICQEASCPNISECWQRRHASFLILGAICTRACAFCNVATGRPHAPDRNEPRRLAAAAKAMRLKHVVVTSVDRDDLPDGGAGQFAACARALRAAVPTASLEFLTPDFRRKPGALEIVLADAPDVFNHNVETVPRLYRAIRPGSDYAGSLALLQQAKRARPSLFTKSGLMLGLGERVDEVLEVMDELRAADVDFLTLGQYMPPSPRHARLMRFVPPEEFADLGRTARRKGFSMVAASPLTRSSYHAERDFVRLKKARAAAVSAAAASP